MLTCHDHAPYIAVIAFFSVSQLITLLDFLCLWRRYIRTRRRSLARHRATKGKSMGIQYDADGDAFVQEGDGELSNDYDVTTLCRRKVNQASPTVGKGEKPAIITSSRRRRGIHR